MHNISILIVEDEAIVAEDLAGKVRQMGYEVAGTTATGEGAVSLALRLRPTLILMDIRLAGGMDGIEAARAIQEECDIPVVFLTAHIDRNIVERAQQAGAFGYILKPYDDRDLRIQIEMALHKYSMVQRLRESEERMAGINLILRAGLTCGTEKELGLACIRVAKELTQSGAGFITNINKDVLDTAGAAEVWSDSDVFSWDTIRDYGVFDRILLDGRCVLDNTPAALPSMHAGGDPPQSILGVPLAHNGSVLGVLAVGNRKGGYSESEQEALQALTPSIVEAFMRKRVERQLQTLNSDLERRVEQRTLELQKTQLQYFHSAKLSAIGKLSASIAHEFNNPLQAIMNVFRGLQKRAVMDEEDRELLDVAVSECGRMKDLIRNLQDFYRPSSGIRAWLDIHAKLDSILLLNKSELKAKRLSVVRNYAKQLPQILGVADQIKQVFLNLMANAADACIQPGGVITITTWQEDEKVAVAIHDTGIGISAENIGKIFDPFYTTKQAAKGTGLGLSVCHGIIQSHRGEIRVESGQGSGTTFTVMLPVRG